MWTELITMALVAASTSASLLFPARAFAMGIVSLVVGFCFGTIGIGLIGFSICCWNTKWRIGTYLGLGTVLLVLLSSRSGQGRLLGMAEAIWMSAHSRFQGVGWGEWTWHQAEAQRAILKMFPLERWIEIAPYFGVAPSLPAHLFAEVGVLGLVTWVLFLGIFLLGLKRTAPLQLKASCMFGFSFLLTSAGTTPIQFFLTVDQQAIRRCNEAIAQQTNDLEKACPEIRALEWEKPATEETYLLWHETFPKDVMPAFALGRLAAEKGDESKALYWLEQASQGNPGRDEQANVFKERARQIVNGDRGQLNLWLATSKMKT